MDRLIFLKLGGSLITDKAGVEAVRPRVLSRLAHEIAQALSEGLGLHLLLGHGSGSFGHVAAARYGTRHGVSGEEQWLGFAEVSAAALRLNRLVTEALLEAGVPAISLQPAASARVEGGHLTGLSIGPIVAALQAGLLPVVHGDVAFDNVLGGTIISTEEILTFLAQKMRPSWLLLAGETEGVYDHLGQLIPLITPSNYEAIRAALGGSHGTDVTGGMASKVKEMLDLVVCEADLNVRIFSGHEAGALKRALLRPNEALGTKIGR